MNKDEQIKRLAQNLFNSGFTKSMDHAIQTAANMLGFPDSMLVSKSTKESREEMGANTVTTGVSGMYNRDLAKRITQSIAEERVFSQVPNSIRSALQPSSLKEPQSQSNQEESNSMSNPINPQMNIHTDTQANTQATSHLENQARDFSDDDLFVNNSYEDDVAVPQVSSESEDMFSGSFPEQNEEKHQELNSEIDNHDLYSSQPHIFDQNVHSENEYSNENFIENNNEIPETEMPEWNEEEQTSLISGFVDSNESPTNDNSEDSFESFSGGETSGNYDNIFKGGDSKNMDMRDNSKDYQIQSRFETVLGGEEDFFTASSRTKPQANPAQMNEEHRQESFESGSAVQSQQSAPPQQANVAEATVDLTQMFDFRNLKN